MKHILLILALAVRVAAASITHTATIFPTLTDWSATNAVPQFDPALGTLTNVTVSVAINGTTGIRFESLDEFYDGDMTGGSAVTGTATVSGFTVVTTLTNSHTQSITGVYDGVLDYAGTGGFRVSVFGSNANSATPANFTPFVGVGNIPLVTSATGVGFYEGPGDYAFGVTTRASALITVTYEFSLPPCPECPPAPVCDPKPSCDPKPDCKPRVKPPQKDDDDCDDDRRKRRNRRR